MKRLQIVFAAAFAILCLPGVAAACQGCPFHSGSGGAASDAHGHTHGRPVTIGLTATASPTASAAAQPFKFAVVGDTQQTEFGGRSNLLTRLVESINTHDVDYVLFPGDLISDTAAVGGWAAWRDRTAALGTNSTGRDKRLMTPGNHDVGAGARLWQTTFGWLPESQVVGGQVGIDRIDYYVDHHNSRFISVATDVPAGQRGGPPQALGWLQKVMKDVDARNADADPANDIDHVFTFSHRPVTTQFESGTGGTNGDWWLSMTGQHPDAGGHAATAFLPGHWHMYQPSRPDPAVDTMEIISGTGGGGLEGQPHRNWHGYSIVTVDGLNVTSEFYGDTNQTSDTWNFELLDSFTVAQAGGLPRGELARYEFNSPEPLADSSLSPLSKHHPLESFAAPVVTDSERGQVLQTGPGGYADAKNVGDNNLAVLGDLTLSITAKAESLSLGDRANTLVSFGAADGSRNGSLNQQESANHAYHLSMTADGRLTLAWQHDDGEWESATSLLGVADPFAWNDYEVRRDGDAMGVAFFANSEKLGPSIAFDSLPTGGGSGSLILGAGGDTASASAFDGWIDAVVINNADVTVADPIEIIPGDFDFDGRVDGDDWTFFAQQVGGAATGPADLNFDSRVDHSDFVLFRSLFEAANGPGSFAALIAEAPEPAAALSLSIAAALFVFSRPTLRCR